MHARGVTLRPARDLPECGLLSPRADPPDTGGIGTHFSRAATRLASLPFGQQARNPGKAGLKVHLLAPAHPQPDMRRLVIGGTG